MGFIDKLFGRKQKQGKADDTLEIMDEAIRFSSEKWLFFNRSLQFNESVGLYERIMTFMVPATEGLKKNFNTLQTAPEPIYLIIIAKGIELSGTHSKEEIENALGVPLP